MRIWVTEGGWNKADTLHLEHEGIEASCPHSDPGVLRLRIVELANDWQWQKDHPVDSVSA